jgi:hypothetical protein
MHALIQDRRAAYGLIGCGSVVFGWAFVLCVALPARTTAEHWSAVWAGLDGMEALGFIGTGVLLLRRGRHLCATAAATSSLLVVDAWFDTMTAAPGADLALALLMAGGLELPLAGVCAAIAWRTAASGTTPGPDPAGPPAPPELAARLDLASLER